MVIVLAWIYQKPPAPETSAFCSLSVAVEMLALPASFSPARQFWTHLHNFGHPNRVGGPSETPLLQETADDVDGFIDLRAEILVWQEAVFEELVQLVGSGLSKLLHDAQAGTGEPEAAELAAKTC